MALKIVNLTANKSTNFPRTVSFVSLRLNKTMTGYIIKAIFLKLYFLNKSLNIKTDA